MSVGNATSPPPARISAAAARPSVWPAVGPSCPLDPDHALDPGKVRQAADRTGIGSSSAAARTASTWSCPISSSATPPGASWNGSSVSSRRTRSRPVSAAVQRERRLEAQAAGARRHLVARDVGKIRHQQIRLLRRGEHADVQQVAQAKADEPGHPVGGQVLRGELQRLRRDIGGTQPQPPQRQGGPEPQRSATATAPLPVPTSQAAMGSSSRTSARRDLVDGGLRQQLRLRARDQRPPVRRDPE